MARQRAAPKIRNSLQPQRFGSSSLRVALVAHLCILILSAHLFFIPAGIKIRPMGWGAATLVICLVTLFIALPLAVIAITKESPRWPGIIGLILGCTPFWFAHFLLHLAMWTKGFHLAP
jgi:hypothetical protein